MDLGLSFGSTQVAIGDEAVPTGSLDVFVVIGQSNAVGYATDDGGAGYPSGSQHWSNAGAWEPIGFRLDHGPWEDTAAANQFGFAKGFATSFAAANPLSDLLFIGAADGGTGFSTGHWNPGDSHYQAVIARINAAMAAAPVGAVLRGFLWHQGESDRGFATYDSALSQLITNLRTDVVAASAATPFIAGGHATDGAWWDDLIQRSVQALPSTQAYCGYADISSPSEPVMGDGVHFDAVSTRALGAAYFEAYQRARVNGSVAPSGTITTGASVYADLTSSAGWSATGISVGGAASDRLVLISIGSRHDSTLPRPESVHLGGVPAMRVVARSTGRVSGTNVALYCAHLPEGTSADLDIVFDFQPQQAGAVLLPIYGAQTPLASVDGYGFDVGLAGHGTSISTTLSAQVGDLVFAASGAIAPGGASGQINLGNTTDNFISGTNRSLHTGHQIVPTAGIQTVTCDFGATVVNYPTIAAMALRPI
ncbi:hypothetical protein GCM10011517_25950 [Actibacterium pelagium]|uniref:Sialate O-acetylesterase domain-containing protein n=2 Tax=Actibacterium pelagium TaxID=2029103 RepID=A0A917EMG5_9RHOB|nr:sialate O-acetylesterase [Actibacterium pelagium]GGE56993.1 hypothetical protein GCM10011517_25950 [Actibacterium pelagium]